VAAKRGGQATGPDPTDRGKAATKRHAFGERLGRHRLGRRAHPGVAEPIPAACLAPRFQALLSFPARHNALGHPNGTFPFAGTAHPLQNTPAPGGPGPCRTRSARPEKAPSPPLVLKESSHQSLEFRAQSGFGLPFSVSVANLPGTMLRYAIIFLVIAIIAELFGFSGIAGQAGWIAHVLFVIAVIFLVISFVTGRGGPTV
jgi:uncharacterized membrane protein YtjA (UPF0391 family)